MTFFNFFYFESNIFVNFLLTTISYLSQDLFGLLPPSSCLSVRHYNVQSQCRDTRFPLTRKKKKDRVDDSHGGVIVYLQDSLLYKRLELRYIECIWVKVILSHSKHIPFSIFLPTFKCRCTQHNSN